jgi:serine/threonine-protein kinase
MNLSTPFAASGSDAIRAPREGDLLENRFRIDAAIAAGTHSTVHAATNIVTDKIVAIKWPRKRRTFDSVAREARLAARVQHPAVIDVYDIGQHEGVFFLTMECIRGGTLRAHIASGAIDCHEFMAAFQAILGAVNALHARGIAHCDLKPTNILLVVNDEGRPIRPKLIDFGSAKLLWESPSATTGFVEPFVHTGSEPYMPPEQRRRSSSIDHRVDIYALGVLLERCIGSWCAPSGMGSSNASLREIISRATASDSACRFENVSEFLSALRAAAPLTLPCVGPRKQHPPSD